MLIKKENKRGDVAIVVLVFLVVFICGTALFFFVQGTSEIKVIINGGDFLEKIYVEKIQTEFFLKDMLDETFLETYVETSQNLDDYFVSGKNLEYGGEFVPVFVGFDLELENDFELKFKENFNLKVLERRDNGFFKDSFLKNLESLKPKQFEMTLGSVYVTFENLKFSLIHSFEYAVVHQTNLNFKLDFDNFNLHSFGEIEKAKDTCYLIADKISSENCFSNELFNFDVTLLEVGFGNETYFLVELNPKSTTYLQGETFKIRFFI